jgi:hypothetical protein
MTPVDAITGTVTSLAVAGLVTSKQVRVAAMLSAGGIVVAYFVHTPVGANAVRLPVMFALPVIVGLCERSRLVVLLSGAVVAVLNPPLVVSDLHDGGDPANYPSYYAALNAELAEQPHIGKIEVVMTPNYWESVYVAQDHLLARGWLRQQDTAQNPLFFKNKAPSTAAYRRWLVDNGVAYVALPSEVSSLGADERRAVHRAAAQVGVGSLWPVWADAHWQLYRVAKSPGLVDGPVTVTRADGGAIGLRFNHPGTALLRINYNRWLSASHDACLFDAGGWTQVQAPHAGLVEITSSLRPSTPATPCRPAGAPTS